MTSHCPKTLPTVYDRDAPDVGPKPDQESPNHTNNIHEIISVWAIGQRKNPPATRSYKLSVVRDTEFECYNGMRYILLKHTSDENSTPESDSTDNSSTGTENGECLIEPGITNLTTTFLSYRNPEEKFPEDITNLLKCSINTTVSNNDQPQCNIISCPIYYHMCTRSNRSFI